MATTTLKLRRVVLDTSGMLHASKNELHKTHRGLRGECPGPADEDSFPAGLVLGNRRVDVRVGVDASHHIVDVLEPLIQKELRHAAGRESRRAPGK